MTKGLTDAFLASDKVHKTGFVIYLYVKESAFTAVWRDAKF